MTRIRYVKCCRIWPVAVIGRTGRCGLCGTVPRTPVLDEEIDWLYPDQDESWRW